MKFYKNPPKSEWAEICSRPALESGNLTTIIEDIFNTVATSGDKALRDYTLKFDNARISELLVSQEEIENAAAQISNELKVSIALAINNVRQFHSAQKLERTIIETSPGVECWQEERPIEKVGLYIPGGSAPLFSTIIMLAVPAQIAGCKELVLCTPPDKDGNINPAILYTAAQTGVTSIFKVGGAQAIAALTYGTESIPAVYKLFGPGNQYVTAAKQFAQQKGVAIDMPAGPSELLVYADETANPAFVASDLLSQAEHGPDSQVVCVSDSEKVLKMVQAEVDAQLALLPRKDIAEKALANSLFVNFDVLKEASQFINEYAPEHLIICSENEKFLVKNTLNAGSVFLGNYSPESAGDYASGTNHTLPTSGYAKTYSGLSLQAFTKKITFQRLTTQGIRTIGPAIETMAEAEGLQAHKNAVTLRLNEIKK
ncbi:MAG: histidinol dehydrogenase [Cyclobacteriaceae bacterium]|nr:histidinol dehydrogenase [Cyclobacteriaceae bacterium]